jgi:hypothetical protein
MPERLLYAISTRGKMPYAAFSTIYSQIYNASSEDTSFTYLKLQTLRFLDALGHCDFDFGKRYVYACKPAFVLIPSFGLPKVLLVGARSVDLTKRIKKIAADNKNDIRFYTVCQKIRPALLPQAICLEVANKEVLRKSLLTSGIDLQIDEPAAWCLINFSSDVSEITNELSWQAVEEPGWPKRIFSITNLAFNKHCSERADFGLVEYTNPRDQQKLHWLWHENKAAEVDRDWGRFMCLNKRDVNVLLYDAKRFLFAVPSSIPLPKLISRALTLCTGLAPSNAVLINQPIMTLPGTCQRF